MEVAEQDGGFRARDHQYEEHDEQEPEHVIYLVGPDTVEYKVELDKDASDGENATHQDPGEALGVERLGRDVPRNLISLGRVLERWLPESEESSNKRQWD